MAERTVILRDRKAVAVPLRGVGANFGRMLRTLPGQTFPEVDKPDFIAKYWVGDAEGNPVPSDGTVTGGDATLRTDLGLGSGAALVGFTQVGAGLPTRSLQTKLREVVSVKDFGALGDGIADDTAEIDLALATGADVICPPGNYVISTLTMAAAGTRLILAPGATLKPSSAITKAINVTAANCSVVGPGKIESPASWDSTTARLTYATIWVAGEDFALEGVTFINIPRAGIHFEDVTNGKLLNNTFRGNMPYATYNEVNTGLCAISYNPPATGGAGTASGNGSLIVSGNRIEQVTQGVFVGNYDAAASEVGIVVTGNSFNRCYDHGVYIILGKAPVVSANSFVNCKYPIAVQGNAATVAGNSLFATETSGTWGQQVISVRNAVDCVIDSNTLQGLGAAIYCDVESALSVDIRRNRITGNTIRRTGTGSASAAIRLGNNAEVCEDNLIADNVISGGFHTVASVSPITLVMKAGFRGNRNIVRANTVHYTDALAASAAVAAIRTNLHDYLEIYDNSLICTSDGGAGSIFYHIFIVDGSYFSIRRNKFYYTTGGANVTARVIQVSAGTGGNVTDNEYFLTSASLAAVSSLAFIGGNANIQRNRLNPTAKMYGTATLANAAVSVVVSNANIDATYSRVVITPTNAAAAKLIAGQGVSIAIAAGQFTLATGDGLGNAQGSSTFSYVLD